MKNISVFLVVIFLKILLLCNNATCQIQFSGKIIDAETKNSLPYVTIVISDKESEGTISNVNGEFALNSLSLDDTVCFSFVGYKSRRIKVSELDLDNIVVALDSEEHVLDEIEVIGFTSQSLIEEAFEKIKDNYPDQYPIFEGVYRKQISENDKLVFIGDCKMKVKGSVYNQNGKKKFPICKIRDKRISENKMKEKNDFNLNANTAIFLYPDMTYPSSKIKNSIESKFVKQFKTNEEEIVYKVVFEDSDKSRIDRGYFYVAEESKAILAMHREQEMKDIKVKTKILSKMYLVFDVFYKKVEMKYVFDYGRASWRFNLSDEKDPEIQRYDIVLDYLVKNRNDMKGKGRFRTVEKDPFAKTKDALVVPFTSFKEIISDYE